MLVAIDPDSASDFEVAGAVFKLGVVPAGVWQRVKFRQIVAYEKSQRKAVSTLRKEGIPVDDVVVSPDGTSKVQRVNFMANTDPDFRAELVTIMADLLRYGIKGHDGIVMPDGLGLPFKQVDEALEGTTVKVVAPETLRVYMANLGVMEQVFGALYKRCELSDFAKKA